MDEFVRLFSGSLLKRLLLGLFNDFLALRRLFNRKKGSCFFLMIVHDSDNNNSYDGWALKLK